MEQWTIKQLPWIVLCSNKYINPIGKQSSEYYFPIRWKIGKLCTANRLHVKLIAMITAETGNITGNVLIVMVVSGWPSLNPRNISSSTFRRFITRCTTFAQQSQRDALCNARFGSDRLNSLVVEMSTSVWLWRLGTRGHHAGTEWMECCRWWWRWRWWRHAVM